MSTLDLPTKTAVDSPALAQTAASTAVAEPIVIARDTVADSNSDFEPLVSPPSNEELYWYLGPQLRWVQVISVIAFALAASSLAKFSLSSPWLYPLLSVLAITIVAAVLSMISGLNKRRISRKSHDQFTNAWMNSTPVAPSVDVFLPSAGEDLEVLRNTYHFVQQMEWTGPLNVWVLDDADKHEVEALAAEYGFHYRVRPDRGHLKKAGNLRHGFSQSNGDFIVIFDADFAPRRDFLKHTIPYMDDEGIGIVQTPQFFETKNEKMGWLERTAGSTQELFYRWVQPSRDRAGAPICVGTCAVYRRSALASVGGFAQIEHSEDVHTGIALTRGGFSVRYVPIVVSRGLCPDDLRGFLNQQYRWCNGSMTLLASGAANRDPITPRQSIAFWSGFMYYISTALNVFFLHVPGMLMAVFFASEVRADHYIPFLAGMWVYFVLMPRVMKSRWRFEVLRVQMAYSFAHALAIVHKLTGRTKGWVATGAVSKGSKGLADTIAKVGSITLTLTLGISWGAFAVDVNTFGIAEFWTMGLFLLGYTYLALPLLVDFLRIVFARAPRPVAVTQPHTVPVLSSSAQ